MHNLKNTIIVPGLVIVQFLLFASGAYALDIRTIRFGQHGSLIRVVMDMDEAPDFRGMVQDMPPRAVFDLPMLSGQPAVARGALPSLIADVRLEPLPGGYSRMSFLLTEKAVIRSAFAMAAQGGRPARLVVDLAPVSGERFAKAVGKPLGTLRVPDASTAVGDTSEKLPFAGVGGAKLDLIGPAAPQPPATLPMVVIDPGHGGGDSGAARHGVQEKNITLSVGLALRNALLATGRYRVAMTREKDVFIRLDERVAIARRAGADLFISIHADSAPEDVSAARGASVYTISSKASDAVAARLAAHENQADLLAGVALPTDAPDVADILVDLTMRETTAQSRYFAAQIVKAFDHNNIPMLPAPSKQAGFVVLKAPDVPSVLIELGFVSNPAEARKLNDKTYRAALGQSVARAVDQWFEGRKTKPSR